MKVGDAGFYTLLFALNVRARRAARVSVSPVRQDAHFRFGINKIKRRSRPKKRRTIQRAERFCRPLLAGCGKDRSIAYVSLS